MTTTPALTTATCAVCDHHASEHPTGRCNVVQLDQNAAVAGCPCAQYTPGRVEDVAACACPDDRCAGHHHAVGEPCPCAATIANAVEASASDARPLLRENLLHDLGVADAATLAATIAFGDVEHLDAALRRETPPDAELLAALITHYIATHVRVADTAESHLRLAGLTLTDVADRAGLMTRARSRLLGHPGGWTVEDVALIAEAAGVNPMDLMRFPAPAAACPPWCTEDHAPGDASDEPLSHEANFDVEFAGQPGEGTTYVRVDLTQFSDALSPEIFVHMTGEVTPAQARDLAARILSAADAAEEVR